MLSSPRFDHLGDSVLYSHDYTIVFFRASARAVNLVRNESKGSDHESVLVTATLTPALT